MGRTPNWSMGGGLLLALCLSAAASAGTLDDIRARNTVRIAFREDAPPFSFKDNSGNPAGYMIDVCKLVVGELAGQLKLSGLSIDYVRVTAADRLDTVAGGKADLLCEPTTETLRRRESLDFSIPTFVDGAGVVSTNGGVSDLKALEGRTVGVLAGTTTEEELHTSLQADGVTATVVAVPTHSEGMAALRARKIAAYFADRAILVGLLKDENAGLTLGDVYLTVEPYALALRRGDEDFRLAVDRALSRIYRSGDIAPVLRHYFGDNALSRLQTTLYGVSALPE
ncbi:MAG TPA: amino acid ABC transporter substrate-binding protein [Acetobacteraceae bacterium]|jgi:ABC-type amino acid transport substrate-binding protein|nr:amino acid ABC transporter substrate-binding protein [Acetobacteraceae bacterium]